MTSDLMLTLRGLRTPRLRLDPLQNGDADDLARLTNETGILRAVDFLPATFGLCEAQVLIDKAGAHECFVGGRLLAGNDLALVCGVHLVDADAIEIGYWVGSAWQRKGLASEAIAAVMKRLHVDYPERTLFAECRPANAPSWQLLESLGFRSTGEQGERPGRLRLVAGHQNGAP